MGIDFFLAGIDFGKRRRLQLILLRLPFGLQIGSHLQIHFGHFKAAIFFLGKRKSKWHKRQRPGTVYHLLYRLRTKLIAQIGRIIITQHIMVGDKVFERAQILFVIIERAALQQIGAKGRTKCRNTPAATGRQGGFDAHGIALPVPGRYADTGHNRHGVLPQHRAHKAGKAGAAALVLNHVAIFVQGQHIEPVEVAYKIGRLRTHGEKLGAERPYRNKAVGNGGMTLQHHRKALARGGAQRMAHRSVYKLKCIGHTLPLLLKAGRKYHPEVLGIDMVPFDGRW